MRLNNSRNVHDSRHSPVRHVCSGLWLLHAVGEVGAAPMRSRGYGRSGSLRMRIRSGSITATLPAWSPGERVEIAEK
jgi:hypothetical protein